MVYYVPLPSGFFLQTIKHLPVFLAIIKKKKHWVVEPGNEAKVLDRSNTVYNTLICCSTEVPHPLWQLVSVGAVQFELLPVRSRQEVRLRVETKVSRQRQRCHDLGGGTQCQIITSNLGLHLSRVTEAG